MRLWYLCLPKRCCCARILNLGGPATRKWIWRRGHSWESIVAEQEPPCSLEVPARILHCCRPLLVLNRYALHTFICKASPCSINLDVRALFADKHAEHENNPMPCESDVYVRRVGSSHVHASALLEQNPALEAATCSSRDRRTPHACIYTAWLSRVPLATWGIAVYRKYFLENNQCKTIVNRAATLLPNSMIAVHITSSATKATAEVFMRHSFLSAESNGKVCLGTIEQLVIASHNACVGHSKDPCVFCKPRSKTDD